MGKGREWSDRTNMPQVTKGKGSGADCGGTGRGTAFGREDLQNGKAVCARV